MSADALSSMRTALTTITGELDTLKNTLDDITSTADRFSVIFADPTGHGFREVVDLSNQFKTQSASLATASSGVCGSVGDLKNLYTNYAEKCGVASDPAWRIGPIFAIGDWHNMPEREIRPVYDALRTNLDRLLESCSAERSTSV
jgi:hypothetical protein